MRADMLPLSRSDSEAVGLSALGWIAGEVDICAQFLGQSGLSADDLRERAQDPEFLGFLLDFLMADEAVLLAFCEAASLGPDRPMRARLALPGGDAPHWT